LTFEGGALVTIILLAISGATANGLVVLLDRRVLQNMPTTRYGAD
jgi:hypothetical protein